MASRNLVAIVTGASSGIGAATGRLLAKQNYAVSLAGRNAGRLNAVAAQCAKAAGANKVLATSGDVVDDGHLGELVKRTVAKYGRIDVLVNNAGAWFESMDPGVKNGIDAFDKTIDVNVRSVIKLTDLCEKHLVKSKGNVVNVSSIGGEMPTAGIMFYSMSKAAINMYTKCLALRLAPKGVRVNAVCPGAIDTPMVADELPNDEAMAFIAATHPIGRIGRAEEVAAMIGTLADSRTAGFVTGSLFTIDGGAMVNNALNVAIQMRAPK